MKKFFQLVVMSEPRLISMRANEIIVGLFFTALESDNMISHVPIDDAHEKLTFQ